MKQSKRTMLLVCVLFVIGLLLGGCQAKKVTGVITLPDGDKAFEDMTISVACVRGSDDIPEEQIVVLPKGESAVAFEIKRPKDDQAFYFRYQLRSKGEAKGVGGLSISNHVYLKEGYLASSGMTHNSADKALLAPEALGEHILTILPEPGLKEETTAILAKILKPEMGILEKERAIYEYVTMALPLHNEITKAYARGDILEKDNPLVSALIDKEAVWLGHPFLMKWLLLNAGINSELVEATLGTVEFTYVYNLVEIENQRYYVDASAASVQIHDQVDRAGDYTFGDLDQARDYFLNRYFNFTDDLNKYRNITLMGENGTPQASDNLKGFALVSNYIKQKSLSEAHISKLRIALELPKGLEAPEGGLWVQVTAKSGHLTASAEDDFVVEQWIVIPSKMSTYEISLPVVETQQGYSVTAHEPKLNIGGSIEVQEVFKTKEPVMLKMDM